MKVFDFVHLDEQAIRHFLRGEYVKNVVTEISEDVARNAGGSAEVRVRYGRRRLTGFVSMDYEEATENNRLLKALR